MLTPPPRGAGPLPMLRANNVWRALTSKHFQGPARPQRPRGAARLTAEASDVGHQTMLSSVESGLSGAGGLGIVMGLIRGSSTCGTSQCAARLCQKVIHCGHRAMSATWQF